jgi:hypothetical protein
MYFIKYHAMKIYGEMEVTFHVTSARIRRDQLHALAALSLRKEPPVPIG